MALGGMFASLFGVVLIARPPLLFGDGPTASEGYLLGVVLRFWALSRCCHQFQRSGCQAISKLMQRAFVVEKLWRDPPAWYGEKMLASGRPYALRIDVLAFDVLVS